jgi:ribose transport system ATP-binding protein
MAESMKPPGVHSGSVENAGNASDAPALQFSGISKSFFGVKVLKAISLSVPAGRTLGLVGENGAGKSTLMNILGGNLRPDTGAMRLFGEPFHPRHPQAATAAGIAFIHQELNLFSNLSIAENLFLTAFPRRRGLIQRRALHDRARALLDEVGLAMPPDTPVERLSAGERQLVEIAKALSIGPRLIILDEPTTSLTARETEHLFALLGRLKARGLTLIYISHALNDVLRLCDPIVVLRDGEVVGAGRREEFTAERMIQLMVGRSMEQLFPPREAAPADAVALEVRGLSQPGMVRNLSFVVHRSEVVGIAGLMGSGRTELARMLFGLDPVTTGTIHLAGEAVERLSPRQRVARGLAFLTESRREEGVCMEASIADNITLVSAPALARGPVGWLDLRALRQRVDQVRQAVTLTPTARNEQPVKTLSGGNQQKVVLAKWLLNDPKVFILDEPTRGIDVGAKYEVYLLIRRLARRGAGVLVISSEIEELIGLCDRILVMRRGEIRADFAAAQFDRERILRAALSEGPAGPAAGPEAL